MRDLDHGYKAETEVTLEDGSGGGDGWLATHMGGGGAGAMAADDGGAWT